MTSPSNNLQPKQGTKDDNNQISSGNRNPATTKPQEQPLKCPRCDSHNTKFCYYNNYSLAQPRHFCKTCKRYWTKGGALRNVPIGGGCRKNRKIIKSSSSSSKDYSTSGLKLFHGLSSVNLGGFSIYNNQFSSEAASFLDPSAIFNYPLSSGFVNGAIQQENVQISCTTSTSPLASSIESLSCINQDLHWKLQQQRLAMLVGTETQKDITTGSSVAISQKPETINLFENLETSKPEVCGVVHSRKNSMATGDTARGWFFGNSYGQAASNSNSSGNGNVYDNTGNWNAVRDWGELNQYNAFP